MVIGLTLEIPRASIVVRVLSVRVHLRRLMCMTGGIGRWRIATEEVGVAGEGVRVKGGGLGKIEILIEPFSSSLLSKTTLAF